MIAHPTATGWAVYGLVEQLRSRQTRFVGPSKLWGFETCHVGKFESDKILVSPLLLLGGDPKSWISSYCFKLVIVGKDVK